MRSVLAILFVFVSSQALCQNVFELTAEQESLASVVKSISKKYDLKFSYSPRVLGKHKITKSIKATSRADFISEVFQDLPFELRLRDGIYLVIPQKIQTPSKPIVGQIYDNQSGEPLAFAHVKTEDRGTLTSQNGRFTLPPTEDTLTLTVSYIGYKKLQLRIPPNHQNLKLKMNQDPMELPEVILTGESVKVTPDPSFFSLNPQQFSSLPMLGETDVFKSLQLLPGVRATDETSSGLVVRGSLPSQNLILMDGFTLYNLDHFFGIFSTLNPNAINNVSIYKGGFGPQYGGRVSSVVDVTGKNGQLEDFNGYVGINMLSFNSAFSIPIGKRTSALIAFRQSFTDVINSSLYQDFLRSNRQNFLESVSPELNTIGLSPTLRFGDLNAKVQHRFTDKSVLDINFYGSQDFYRGDFVEDDDFEQFEVLDKSEWSNIGISANLKSQLKPNWFNNTTISASEYRENESLSITQTLFEDVEFLGDSIEANSAFSLVNYSIGSSVGDVTLKSHNEIDIDDQNMISAGVEINALNTTYNSTESLTFEQRLAGLDPEVIPGYADTLDLDATIVSFYGNYQFRKEEITTNLGIRSSYYEPTQKWYLEPRFDIGLRVNEQLALKGAASFHHQFISETSLSFLQNTDQFYWTLADDEAIPVQRSTHFIVGGTYNFGNWSLDLEYYNRRTGGILENQFLTLSPDVLDEIGFEDLNLGGENYAEGLDLFLKYKNRTFTSLLSYSLGRSENAFWYRNQNNPYPSAQDQRHELNFTNILKLGKVELASIFLLGTGQRYTPQNETINLVNETGSIYDLERINESKLPAYQRLDLSAKYSFKVGSFDFESGVTLFNVLNKINIKSRRYSLKFIFEESATNTSGRDEIEVIPLDTQLLGFTPNFFLNVRF